MNRKKMCSLFLIVFFVLAMVGFVIADSNFIEFMASVNFGFREAQIEHTAVNTVSKEFGVLDLKSSVKFGDYISAVAMMEYYVNDDIVNISTVAKGAISNMSVFYMDVDNLKDKESVSYRIVAKLKKEGSEEDFYAYWPSSTTFNKAIITDSTSTAITAAEGGIVEFESGNQEYKNTKIIVPCDALSGDTTITIKQLPVSQLFATANGTSQMITLYSVTSNPNVEIISPLIADFYYGSETEVKKFDLKYRANESSPWENIEISNIDLENRVLTANIIKFGQYGVFVASNLDDSDYRPQKRVRVKSRIQSGRYSGFEFKYLQEGDVVKIYNVNGKKIREIKEGTGDGFNWDGRKDNGDWAESGTYIYQIKLKEKGKIISGTIAFVW